jgi:hypothetical protein
MKITDKRNAKKAKEDAKVVRIEELIARGPSPEDRLRALFYTTLSSLVNNSASHVGLEKTLDWLDEASAEWRTQLGARRLSMITGYDKGYHDND